MVIIRNWRRDERNKAFIKALKRMWPRPTPRGTVRRAAGAEWPASGVNGEAHDQAHRSRRLSTGRDRSGCQRQGRMVRSRT